MLCNGAFFFQIKFFNSILMGLPLNHLDNHKMANWAVYHQYCLQDDR